MFYEGQKVVCISESFPRIYTTDKANTLATDHPKKGETLVINEILGDFLRFDKYDDTSFNWWHSSRFRPLDSFTIELNNINHEKENNKLCSK